LGRLPLFLKNKETSSATAHGESAEGTNAGLVHTHHSVTATIKITKSGTLLAAAYCNIHGFWENSKTITVE